MKEEKTSISIRVFANVVTAIIAILMLAYFVIVFAFGLASPIVGIIAFVAQFFK